MSANPQGGLDGVQGEYVYRVEPLGPVERRDSAWYGNVQGARLKEKYRGTLEYRILARYPEWSEEMLAINAEAYWSGRASDKPNWEYLTVEATVAELVGQPRQVPGRTL